MQPVGAYAAINLIRVPDDHLALRNPHRKGCVASEVLVGEEENFFSAGERPLEGCAGVRRGADQAAVSPAEAFDCRSGVHVGQRNQSAGRCVGQPGAHERIPAIFDLADLGHVGHRAACVQVRQNHLLPWAAKDVGGLRHKVHAAEDHVLRVGPCCNLRELVTVASDVGKPNHLIALVVMAQQNDVGSQFGASRGDACVHGVVGLRKIVVQRAGFCDILRNGFSRSDLQ